MVPLCLQPQALIVLPHYPLRFVSVTMSPHVVLFCTLCWLSRASHYLCATAWPCCKHLHALALWSLRPPWPAWHCCSLPACQCTIEMQHCWCLMQHRLWTHKPPPSLLTTCHHTPPWLGSARHLIVTVLFALLLTVPFWTFARCCKPHTVCSPLEIVRRSPASHLWWLSCTTIALSR